MKKILVYRLTLITLTLFINSAKSQPIHVAYAVTTISNGGNEWIALRALNIPTGKFSNILVNMNERSLVLHDHATHKIITNSAVPVLVNYAPGGNSSLSTANSGVAAIAYHSKTNRLYYVSMSNDQLRYIDLSTMKAYSVMDQSFSKAGHYVFQTASPITRLVIAPDDYGYTITTDGNRLIRFTTSSSPALTNLGELVDDPHNNEMSIYNTCSNAGGDIIADDAGNLYLITASNRVFKVDINSRITTYVATIAGLPPRFTTNGAAVDENGQVLVSSSVYTDAFFTVDPKTWIASPSPAGYPMVGTADLASGNVLHTKNTPSVLFVNRLPDKSGAIKVFPNPVLFDQVSIQFNELPLGNYTIQMANALGEKVLEQKVTITNPAQTEIMHIPAFTAQAFYYIRILNEKNIVVSTHKLAVERW